jgi:hypothetical protein
MKTKDNIGVITPFALVADIITTNDWFQKEEICIGKREKAIYQICYFFIGKSGQCNGFICNFASYLKNKK